MRLPSGISLEAGGDYSAFAGSSDLNYGEVFVGARDREPEREDLLFAAVFRDIVESRLWRDQRDAARSSTRVRLHVHVGFLRYRYDNPYGYLYGVKPVKNVIDGRIGLRADLEMFQLELAWVGVSNHTAAYFVTGRNSPNGVVAALSLSF